MSVPAPENVITTTPDAGPAGEEKQEPKGQAPGAKADEGAEQVKPDQKPIDELPQWAQDEITSTRAEAAARRRQVRELEDKLQGAKSQADIDTAVSEWKTKVDKLENDKLRSDIARDAKLPAELASRLYGNTAEELTADAVILAKFLVSTPNKDVNLRGGLDPDGDTSGGTLDPAKLAADIKRPTLRF